MEALRELGALQQKDQEDLHISATAEKIAQSEKVLSQLKAECQRLTDEKLAKSQIKQKLIKEICQEQESLTIYGQSDDFFSQLRLLESQEEYLKSETSSLSASIRSLTEEVRSSEAKNKTELENLVSLKQQREEILARLSEAQNSKEKEAEVKVIAEEEFTTICAKCEQLKKDVIQKSEELLQMQSEGNSIKENKVGTASKLLELKREELGSLKTKEKELHATNEANEQRRRKALDDASSPQQWINERQTLLAKVKAARAELSVLSRRDQSANSSKLAIKSKFSGSEEDAKKAVAMEINEIGKYDNAFLQSALEAEERREKRLERELEEAKSALNQLNLCRSTHSASLEQQNNCLRDDGLIAILKAELGVLSGSF